MRTTHARAAPGAHVGQPAPKTPSEASYEACNEPKKCLGNTMAGRLRALFVTKCHKTLRFGHFLRKFIFAVDTAAGVAASDVAADDTPSVAIASPPVARVGDADVAVDAAVGVAASAVTADDAPAMGTDGALDPGDMTVDTDVAVTASAVAADPAAGMAIWQSALLTPRLIQLEGASLRNRLLLPPPALLWRLTWMLGPPLLLMIHTPGVSGADANMAVDMATDQAADDTPRGRKRDNAPISGPSDDDDADENGAVAGDATQRPLLRSRVRVPPADHASAAERGHTKHGTKSGR